MPLSATATQLRHAAPDEPGLSRRRAGRGFSYRDAHGRLVDPKTREWIESLAIPPAWEDVWIAADPQSHLLATGVDAAGRTQYLYHPQWRAERDAEKFQRVEQLGHGLAAVRRQLRRELEDWQDRRDAPRAAVESLGLLLLDTGALRLGSEAYEQENGSRGAATLLVRNVQLGRGVVTLQFHAKGGEPAQVTLRDRLLVQRLKLLTSRRPGEDYLLSFRDDGEWRHLTSEMVGARFRALAGEDFSVKDLRTWAATVAAAEALAREASGGSTDRTQHVRAAIAAAAETIGDTVAVARGSYVDPRLLRGYENSGRTVRPTRGEILQHSSAVRRRVERELLALLSAAPSAD